MQEQPTQPQPANLQPSPPQPAPGDQPPGSDGIPITERIERLSRMVSARTLEGWVVIDRNDRDPSVVLMSPGKPVNHVLHFLIGVFTCGIWWIVWVILALTQKKEQRMRLTIDPYGNLLEEKMTVAG